MNIRYDAATDSLHIHLSDDPSADSDELQGGAVRDYDAGGALVGIDLPHARQRVHIKNLSLSGLPVGQLQAV